MHGILSGWTRRGVLVALSAFAVGCGGDSPTDGGGAGTYTATISGALTGTISGNAFFATGIDPDTQEQAWIAYLVDGNISSGFTAGDNVMFFGRGAPTERTYNLEDISTTNEFPDGEAGGFVITYTGQTLVGALGSTGGTLVVTSVSGTTMNGTFNFTAEGSVFDGANYVPGSVTVSGTFQATGGNFLTPF